MPSSFTLYTNPLNASTEWHIMLIVSVRFQTKCSKEHVSCWLNPMQATSQSVTVKTWRSEPSVLACLKLVTKNTSQLMSLYFLITWAMFSRSTQSL